MKLSAAVRTGSFVIAGLVCCLITDPAGARAKKEEKQIQGQERVLHALDRFTFGPRPGDVAAVEAMGLQKWFDRQLNPGSIDDSALDARLSAFPAMKMSQAELMARYPTPQALRVMVRTGMPLPRDPVEHAIYADDIARYEAAKAKKAATDASNENTMQSAMAKNTGEDVNAVSQGDGSSMASAASPEQKLYSDLNTMEVINLPPVARMQRIVAMSPQEFIAFRKSLKPRDLRAAEEGLNPEQTEIFEALQGGPRMVGAELLRSRMLRDIYSERQLQAVMTDFWLNHFNVYLRKNQNEPYLLPSFERDVIRPNALGKFEDLLVATAKSAAMLVYLDNWQSIGPNSVAAKNAARTAQRAKNPQARQALKDRGLNENYGRELMELHTIGVQCEVSVDRPARELDKSCGKGYTQQDVIEVAKAFTGWTIDRPNDGAEYRFEVRRHEPGSKMVLGTKIHDGGEKEGLQVLHILATSPATARLISMQLAIRFVSDTPPPALVERMTQAFEASDGDIRTVLRAMFDSPEFWSPEIYRAKVKTPIEFVVSAARASGVDVTNAQPLVDSVNRLGMPLYGMQTPNGYSWKADGWVNTGDLVDRMNFALILSSDRMNGVQTDWRGLLNGSELNLQRTSDNADASAAAKEKTLEKLLLGQSASDHTRETVLQQFRNTATQDDATKQFPLAPNQQGPTVKVLNAGISVRQLNALEDREAELMAGLLIGSPEFQRR